MASKDELTLTMNGQDMTDLKERLEKRQLSDADYETLLKMLRMLVVLRATIQKRGISIIFWLRRIFGLKTERSSSPTKSSGSTASSNKKGRMGRDDYPGANKVNVDHPDLKQGDTCPECHEGKLREIEPGVDYDWQGQTPIFLTIYLLQRFICHRCKETFTAPSPVAETAKTVDDSTDEKKATKCNRNARANAIVACLRFLFGVPFYRLAQIQHRMGIGLPESNQYAMIGQVYSAALNIYLELATQAAQKSLILADDTSIKILDWMAGKGPPSKIKGKNRKKATTTAIVAKSVDDRPIVLYLTDEKSAGRHVESLLSQRTSDRGVPIYMCDGLLANKIDEQTPTILVHCLDHARRQFFNIKSQYPQQAQHVLDQLAMVYKVDAKTKQLNLSADERCKYHSEHSLPVLESLGKWMQDSLKTEETEENSPLGLAMTYSLKRWSELTEFCHTPGVPLSNAECERNIKRVITHRKNSLFYKTAKGAQVGDVIQSLIVTCHESGINCFDYLTWIQENKSAAQSTPEKYLPWCLPQKN